MTQPQAREDWLAERRKSIGASEIAALFSCHRFHSPYSLWSVKTGRTLESAEMEEAAKWGLRLEPAIAQGYAEDYGVELEDPGRFAIARHPQFPFLSCTFDRLIVTPEGRIPLEIKLPSDFKFQEWEQDDAPLYMHLQVMQQIAIADAPYGVLFALVGGQRPRRIEIQRDEELIWMIINAGADFMRLVETNIAPPVDEHDATTGVLRDIEDAGGAMNLPASSLRWDAQIERVAGQMKRLEAIDKRNRNRLRKAIGDKAVGILPTGECWTNKANKKGDRVLRRG